jgi:PAS domain S-box-containing protein
MKNFTLKKKITLATFFSGIGLALVLSVVIFWYLDTKLVNQKIDEISKLGVEQAHESTKILEADQLFAKMLGTRTRVKEFLLDRSEARRTELLGIFNDYIKEDSKYLAIYLLDTNGVGVLSTDERFVGQDYSFRDYFQRAKDGIPNVDVLMGKTSNQFGYYFAHPVVDDGGIVIGVLVVKIDNQEIDKAVLNSEVAKNSTIMLVDKYGVVLASSAPDRFLKSLGEMSIQNKEIIKETDKLLGKEIIPLQYGAVQKIIENYRGLQVVEMYDSVDKEQEILSVIKLSNLPFYLVLEIGKGEIRSLIFSTILIILLVVILGVLLSSFVIYRLILIFISPIEKFKILSEFISRGDFSKRLHIEAKDEFGDLAFAFDKMTDYLDDLYKNLDQKVKERTSQIEVKSKEVEEQKVAILNILEDVQKEKNKSEELAAIVRDTNESIVAVNMDGIVQSWNHGAEQLYQYAEKEVLGKSIKFVMPDDKIQDYDYLKDLVGKTNSVASYKTKRKKKDGTIFDASVSLSPIRDASGNITGASISTVDITKEQEVDKAKTEFVSLASHQLRTPLSAINWYAEMLIAGDAGQLNEEQSKYLKEIYAGNQRMVALVNALLNVSRLDLGTFIIEPKSTNVPEMIKSVINELKSYTVDKQIVIQESYQDNLPEFLADQSLLRIIFQNLLSNSAKYTPAKGNISISVNILHPGDVFGGRKIKKDSFTFSVSDSGMGVPIDQQDKIFSKLFRADNARETETEGTGLGLYIVKSIIDKSEGEIWFESEENKGTTFYVIFPISGMKKKEGTRKLD